MAKKKAFWKKAIPFAIVFLFVFVAFSPIYMDSNGTSPVHEHSVKYGNQAILPSTSNNSVSSNASGVINGKYLSTLVLSNQTYVSGYFNTTNILSPYGMAYNNQSRILYISDYGSNGISEVNISNGSVIRTVPVTNEPAGLLYIGKRSTLYIAESGQSSVSVLDTKTSRINETISVQSHPNSIAYDPANNTLFVTNSGSNSVSVINLSREVVVENISVGSNPTGIIYDSLNNLVYVSNYDSNSVTVIDASNYSIMGKITVASNPEGILLDRANNRIFVADHGSGEVSVINPTIQRSIFNITVGSDPFWLSIDNSTCYLFVSNSNSGTLSVVNTNNNSLLTSVVLPSGSSPHGILFLPGTHSIYIADYGTDEISVVSGNTFQIISNIQLGYSPQDIAFDSSNNYLYITNSQDNNVDVLNTSNGKIIKAISVGNDPGAIAYDSFNGYIYVGNWNSRNITVINSQNNSVIGWVPVNGNPYSFAINPYNGTVYVSLQSPYTDSGSVGGFDFNYNAGIAIISGTNFSDFRILSVGSFPYSIVFDPINSELYIAAQYVSISYLFGFLTYSYGFNGAVVLNTTTYKVQDIHFGEYLGSITFDPSNKMVYESGYQHNHVYVINTSNNTNVATISVGKTPNSLLYNPNNKLIYVVDKDSNSLDVISGVNNTVIASIATGTAPNKIAIDTATGNMLVTQPNNAAIDILSVFSERTYTVTFIEKGLLHGIYPFNNSWSVVVDGSRSTSVGSTISYALTNGTYSYTVEASGYKASPASGQVTVNGSAVSQNITFISYKVKFTETGLPSGTTWYVYLTNNDTDYAFYGKSTKSAIPLNLVNGSYIYTFATTNKVYLPYPNSGSFTVNGKNLTENVTFSLFRYSVNFKETGLPSNTAWYVNVTNDNGTIIKSGAITVTHYPFELINGTYTYTVQTANKTYSAPGESFIVNGKNLTENVTFSPVNYSVTFKETGLPSNTAWYVNVTTPNGAIINSGSLTGTSYYFELTNGTYKYTISTSNKIYSALPYSSSFIVNGKNLSEKVTFTPVKYSVTFTETGLPPATAWYVNVTTDNGTIIKSGPITGSSYSFSITNGTYTYTIATTNKIYSPSPYTGPFKVNGSNLPEKVTFSKVTYNATFNETGLPSGITWYVNGTGMSGHNNSPANITFMLTNGTYTFTVTNLSSYYTTTSHFTVAIDGKNVTKNVYYFHWAYITGTVSPVGATLTINGITEPVSSSGHFNVTAANGTYYIVATESGHKTYYNNVTLNPGKDKNVAITLKPVSKPSSISSIEIYAIIGGVAAIAVIGGVVFVMKKKK